MTYGNLPPQAYTKETVAKAFEWLQSQSDDIKAVANDTDQLVALYLRAKRGGSYNASAPVSSQKFRSDLKELATELSQFEGAAGTSTKSQIEESVNQSIQQSLLTPNSAPATPIKGPEATAKDSENIGTIAPPPTFSQRPVAKPSQPMPEAPPQTPQATSAAHQERAAPKNLDQRTQLVIQDVKTRLNLGSDMEALRMLVSLGYEKAKEILPPPTE